MSKIKCKLICNSVQTHVQQLYTGFHILANNRLLDIDQDIDKDITNIWQEQHLKKATDTHLKAVIHTPKKNRVILHFDNHDSKEIHENHLNECDFYFKRSYSEQYIYYDHNKNKNKIFPLGLNYYVLPNDIDFKALHRNFNLCKTSKQFWHNLIANFDIYDILKMHSREKNLSLPPSNNVEPNIIFIAGVYDPYDVEERKFEKIEERNKINETRVSCISALQKEFKQYFYGGLMHSDYAQKHYKKFLVNDRNITRKKNYIRLLYSIPICVATTGLHGSIGYKFSEYVALSKAIVSEKLQYQVPGPFYREQNYLEFTTLGECVEEVYRLFNNPELRHDMMVNNFCYYHHYLRPDMLVLNAISLALTH